MTAPSLESCSFKDALPGDLAFDVIIVLVSLSYELLVLLVFLHDIASILHANTHVFIAMNDMWLVCNHKGTAAGQKHESAKTQQLNPRRSFFSENMFRHWKYKWPTDPHLKSLVSAVCAGYTLATDVLQERASCKPPVRW